MSSSVERIPWHPITPLDAGQPLGNGSLAALEALRREWERRWLTLRQEEQRTIRQRTLRRLAIETGILERLYDVEWGLTLTLVAEGFTRDVVERAGGVVDERTLATLRAHMDSLGMVLDFLHANRQLSTAFIKELHQAITRTQDSYLVTDGLGRLTQTALPRGEWKLQANHVLRRDGKLLEYCPPEQVASEMDRLIELWQMLDRTGTHPIVKAAWLQHRFVQIHPFADGNGRVARALTLLVLEKHRYAPLVVDRWHRSAYLDALEAANDGQLRPLVRLFCNLETAALTAELERPREEPEKGMVKDVAHTLAAQMAEVRRRQRSDIQQKLQVRAIAVSGRVEDWLRRKRNEIETSFKQEGLGEVEVVVLSALPPKPNTSWYRRQIYESARRAGHHADLDVYAAWQQLLIATTSWKLRFVVSLHGLGHEVGAIVATTFAEVEEVGGERSSDETKELLPTTSGTFAFVHTESPEDIEGRADDLEAMLDDGLSEALLQVMARRYR